MGSWGRLIPWEYEVSTGGGVGAGGVNPTIWAGRAQLFNFNVFRLHKGVLAVDAENNRKVLGLGFKEVYEL